MYIPPSLPAVSQDFNRRQEDISAGMNPENFGWAKNINDEDYSERTFQPIRVPSINVEIK